MTEDERKILVTVCLGALLFFNSLSSINVALPTIQREFSTGLATVQWVSIIGVVMISTLSLCFGRAGDILGRRKLYRSGIVLYTIGSGLSAVSHSITQLLMFRGIMALGLAMAAPMSAAILASNLAPERRGWALGLYASASGTGRAIGPTIGGILLYFCSWRAIFVMNFLIGLFVSVAVFRVLKGEEERNPAPFDFIGTTALLIAFPSLLIALSLGTASKATAQFIPLLYILAAAGTAAFLWVESRTSEPLINTRLFGSLPFSCAILSLVVFSATHSPIAIAGPLYMENVMGMSSIFVGLIMTTLPVFTALSSPLSGRLADRFNAVHVAMMGMVFLISGIWLYAHLGTGSHFLSVTLSFALIGTGIGFFTPANQRTAFAVVGKENYGIVSAMLSSFGTASGTLGVAVMVMILEHMMAGKGFNDPAFFASAQQFSFMAMLPMAGIGLVVLFISDMKKGRHASLS